MPRPVRNLVKLPRRTVASLRRRLDPDHRLAWAWERVADRWHGVDAPPPRRVKVDLDPDAPPPAGRCAARVLILGWYGNETTGDQAILGGVLRRLDPSRVVQTTSDARVSRDTLLELGAEAVTLIEDSPAAVSAALEGVDVVMVGGGPIKEGPMLERWAEVFAEAGRRGKGRMIYGCGIGPIKSPRSARALRGLLAETDVATLRDAGSRALAASLGADVSAAWVAADPALAFDWDHAAEGPAGAMRPPPPGGIGSANSGGIGVSLRYLARDYHRGPGTPAQTEAAAAEAYVQLIDHVHRTTDRHVWLVPMQLEGDQNDRRILGRLRERLEQPDRAGLLDYRGPHDLVRRLSALELMVGMRFHSLVLSWLAGVPAVGVDYDMAGGKVSGVMAQMGAEPLRIRLGELTGPRLIGAYEQLRQEQNRWRMHLAERLEITQRQESLSAAALAALVAALPKADAAAG